MKPDLRRFALLHQVAADLHGYPDWQAGFMQVRVLDRKAHRGITLGNHEIRYIQESDDDRVEQDGVSPLATPLFDALQVRALQRMGHRRWYVLPLEMSYQEAVDLFHLRYYPPEDPARALGHQIQDLLYRVDTVDVDRWHWHINYAPAPRSQTLGLLEYDFDAHWGPDRSRVALDKLSERIPEVGLFLDLDCYRDTVDMPVADWDKFVVRSREKMDEVSKALIGSFAEQVAV